MYLVGQMGFDWYNIARFFPGIMPQDLQRLYFDSGAAARQQMFGMNAWVGNPKKRSRKCGSHAP